MFKKLQFRIVCVIMLVLTVLLTSILIAIYISSYQRSAAHTNLMLKRLCRDTGFEKLENDKLFSEYDSNSYYLVLIGEDNKVIRISNDRNSGYTDKELGDLALLLAQKGTKKVATNYLSYTVAQKKSKIYVAFYNNRLKNNLINKLFYDIMIFGCVGLILLFLISLWLSRWIVTPAKNAFEKQKRFISDASHELKTPIAIISSNADAIQRETGDNKWLDYIKNETVRMNHLVTSLLELARIDSSEVRANFTRQNLSELVLSTVLPFESIAFEKRVKLMEKIEEEIYLNGDAVQLTQLTSILIDNAMNHTDENGTIEVSLKKHLDKKILMVANTGKAIPVAEQKQIFERFYRSDEARNRESGNYGLGLAIAKAITQNHNGKISVSCKNHWTIFKVIL